MASAAFALQAAVFARLQGDAGLTAMLGGPRVYDDVPVRADFPYLTFGQSIERDWSTATDDGKEHTLTVHVWSRAAGRKESDDILELVRGLLHTAALTLSGHRLINLRHEMTEVRRDPDGETFHGIARFRAVTEPV
jgi:Protein of unknown function (DUF3168)